MPLDHITAHLSPGLRKIAQDLKFYYGAQQFSGTRAATALGVSQKSLAAYLSMLVKAGVMERVKKGVFRNLADADLTAPAKPQKLVKAVEAAIEQEQPAARSEHVLKCEAMRKAFEKADPARASLILGLPSSISAPSRDRLMAGR